MVPVTFRYVYTPPSPLPPNVIILRHHAVTTAAPPSPVVADIPGSGSPFQSGSLAVGDVYPAGTVAPTFQGFTFMFWSVSFTGTPASNNQVVNNSSLGPITIMGPAQIWAWYCHVGGSGQGGGGPSTPQVWIDAFDISQGNFSNDPTIVQVVTPPATTPDPNPTVQSNANQLGVVFTNLSAEQIQAKAALLDSAVFNHWGCIFGATTPPTIKVDMANNKQLDASQNSGLAYWVAFYNALPSVPPSPDPCAYWETALANFNPSDFPSPADARKVRNWLEEGLRDCRRAHPNAKI